MNRLILALLLAVVAVASAAAVQIPDTFTNLKSFPKDIERDELLRAMRHFSLAVGVRCQHCHAGGPGFDTMDFASDEKEAKRVARRMLSMVQVINDEHVARLGRSEHVSVQCATCHGGATRPEPIESIVRSEIESSGTERAAARYRELRDEHYGSAAYDFGVVALNMLAEELLNAGDMQAAVDVLELNFEFHKDSIWLSNFLGQTYLQNGDRDAARRAFTHSLEIDPDNAAAKKRLQELDPEN